MNMKQKLTYMLIGCLFTLAGYVLSNLFNTPTHVQAQDEKTAVFETVVCKTLRIIDGGPLSIQDSDHQRHTQMPKAIKTAFDMSYKVYHQIQSNLGVTDTARSVTDTAQSILQGRDGISRGKG